jgi:hypothetical protein
MSLTLTRSFAFSILAAFALTACSAAQSDSSASDNAFTAGSSSPTSKTTIAFGDQTSPFKATGKSQRVHFVIKDDGAQATIDVNENFHEGMTLKDPPTAVMLFGPDGKQVTVESSTATYNGPAIWVSYVEMRVSSLKAGTYTIVYTGAVGQSYWVELRGHDGKGKDAPCDVAKGVRNNPVCGPDLRCDDTCVAASGPNDFCYSTEKGGDDLCESGYACKFDKATSEGDEGYDGLCRKQ